MGKGFPFYSVGSEAVHFHSYQDLSISAGDDYVYLGDLSLVLCKYDRWHGLGATSLGFNPLVLFSMTHRLGTSEFHFTTMI